MDGMRSSRPNNFSPILSSSISASRSRMESDAAREIRTVCPDTKIVFVSQESSREIVEEAFALGAKGYIVKSAVAAELMTALDVVIGGDYFLGSRRGGYDSGKPADMESSRILERAEVLRF